MNDDKRNKIVAASSNYLDFLLPGPVAMTNILKQFQENKLGPVRMDSNIDQGDYTISTYENTPMLTVEYWFENRLQTHVEITMMYHVNYYYVQVESLTMYDENFNRDNGVDKNLFVSVEYLLDGQPLTGSKFYTVESILEFIKMIYDMDPYGDESDIYSLQSDPTKIYKVDYFDD